PVRVARRVGGIEAGDEADVPQAVGQTVDEAAAERAGVERPVQGVDDAALLRASRRHLPQLLHAGGVDLRLAVARQAQRALQLLRDRAARALAQHREPGEAVGAGLIRGLLVAVLVDALVAGAHAEQPLAVEQRVLRRRLGGDQHAALLRLRREPLR